MKKLIKILCLNIVFALFPFLANVSLAESTDSGEKVKLGLFIVEGINSNFDASLKPEWFNEYYKQFEKWQEENPAERNNKKLFEYAQINPLYVTKEQAKEITMLYGDDLIPLMYTPQELSVPFSDFSGIEYLNNLKTLGIKDLIDNPYGINGYPFSREQIGVYYQNMVEAFRNVNAKEIWPNLDYDTLRSNNNFPWDRELRKITEKKITNNAKKVEEKIDASSLTDEDKKALKDKLAAQLEKAIKDINELNAYDLSTNGFESEFEKNTIVEIDKIDNTIRTLERIDISVSKVWDDKSTDKKVTVQLIKKKVTADDSSASGSNENIPKGYEAVKGADGTPLTLVLTAENNYKGVFKKVLKHEKDGTTLAQYGVYEVETEGYTSNITGDQNSGFVIVNKKIVKPIKTAPKTGENSHIELFALMMLISMGMFMIIKKKSIN